jgi:predicted RNase H-like nuclease (RuvC/YqgF family)
MTASFWVLAIVLGAFLILQGAVLRIVHRRKAARQHARYQQAEQAMNGKIEQTKRQIGQLQTDLAAARRQIKQLGKGHAQPVPDLAAERWALERELDDAPSSRHALPPNGFADTRPSPQVTQFGSLLFQ